MAYDPTNGIRAAHKDLMKEIAYISDYTNDSNLQDYEHKLNAAINSMQNTNFNSVEDIFQASKLNNINSLTYNSNAKTFGEKAGFVGKRMFEGAAIGTEFAPGWGTLIGTAAGLVDGLWNNALETAINKKRDAKAWDYYNKAGTQMANAMNYGLGQIGVQNMLNQEFYSNDMGGPLNHGTLWKDNVILVDNGGTHEQNPYGGVLMGFDEEGIPNMVEEGEVIWNDYVFSNRLKVPMKLRKKYKMDKGGSLTFADAIKKSRQFKMLEELPNDKITKDTFNSFISEMAAIQEELRQKDIMKEYNKMVNGGPLINKYSGEDTDTQQIRRGFNLKDFIADKVANYKKSLIAGNTNTTYAPDVAYKGDIEALENSADYIAFTDYIKTHGEDENVLAYLKMLDDRTVNASKLFGKDGKLVKGWQDIYEERRNDQLYGVYHLNPEFHDRAPLIGDDYLNAYRPALERTLPITSDKIDVKKAIESIRQYNNGSTSNNPHNNDLTNFDTYGLVNGLNDLGNLLGIATKRPDYSDIARYENYALGLPRASTHPIGNYVRSLPLDIYYAANRQSNQQRNTKRLLTNLSAGNNSIARAGIVASDAAANDKFGDLLFAAQDARNKQMLQDATFNRGTDQYNSEDAYKTMVLNGEYKTKGLQALMQGAHDRAAIDAGYSKALSDTLSTATQNAYDWAKYQKALKMIQENSWFTDDAKRAIFAGKNGGLLTVKKIRRK